LTEVLFGISEYRDFGIKKEKKREIDNLETNKNGINGL